MHLHSASSTASRPILLDTDMGNDIDDALALAMLHAMESRGECRLLGITINKPNRSALEFTNLFNTFYGRGHIPLAQIHSDAQSPQDDRFAGPVCELKEQGQPVFARTPQPAPLPSPAELMRQALASASDPVSVVSIGFLSNLAALLTSPEDQHSPLNGRELVAAKVQRLVIMGGNFSDQALAGADPKWANWNIVHDILAAQTVVHHWPGEIVFLGYEMGLAVRYPARSIENDFKWAEYHPLEIAYRLWDTMPYDRPCWDPLSALYAVRPDSSDFTLSEPGRITVDNTGYCGFTPDSAGRHYYLSANEQQQQRLQQTLVHLCSKPTDQLQPASI